MRVMVVRPGPLFSVADVHNGLVKGLRANGCEVIDFKYDDLVELFCRVVIEKEGGRYQPAFSRNGAFEMAAEHIQGALFRVWPDVLILTSGFWVPPLFLQIMKARPQHVVAWFTESPYEDDMQANMAPAIDTVILNDPTNLDHFRSINPRSFYFPHSYDPDTHWPGNGDRTVDVAFVGTGFQSRIDFLEQVDWSGIDLKLAGSWRELDAGSPLVPRLIHGREACILNGDTADLYRRSKASFNLYRKETSENGSADGWAMGPREVELAATQTWFAREPRPEGDSLFPMLPTFTEPAELEQQLRWALAHEAQAQQAAAKACEAIVDRTFVNSTARLLSLIDSQPKILA
jgi:hypothetical protein